MSKKAKSDKIKIRIHVSNGLVGCTVERTIEVDREDWEDMETEERDELCRDIVFGNIIEWGYEEEESG